jgi:hypothetical protein
MATTTWTVSSRLFCSAGTSGLAVASSVRAYRSIAVAMGRTSRAIVRTR